MSGLELVARDSKSQLEKNEAAARHLTDVFNTDDDERNWSFSYLKNQLLLKNSQELFRRYQVRVQHALFVELLTFNVVYNAMAFLAFLFLTKQPAEMSAVSSGVVKTALWSRGLSLFIQVFMFGAAYQESLFRSSCAKIAAACIILICMIQGEMATTIYRLCVGHPESAVRQMYYVVLTTSVLLPFPRKLYSGLSAAAVITLDLMLSSLSSFNRKKIVIVLCADAVFYATVLSAGLFIRYLIEVMSRRAFLDRRECIESRIKLETERNQEEKFLQSILPDHIARQVREDIRKVIRNWDHMPMTHKPFNKLYVEKHEGISILYADIVNSMLLAASLKVSDLVDTLNDLFGRFDDSAEKNGCMRIKLLGDCYYCVSGVPDKIAGHADNCVLTGLKMIDIIRSVREKRNVDVDMRIGIHTGNILGGLLGVRKWQFDIWSKDVTIASHMEQAGVPGHVHITKATKDHLLDNCYDIRPGEGHLRDEYLQKEGIATYLIRPRNYLKDLPKNAMVTPETPADGTRFQRQASTASVSRSNISRVMKRQSSEAFFPVPRRGALNYSLHQYRKMVSQVNKIMENTIDKMALSKRDQWFSSVGIQPLLLMFRESGREIPYLEQPDPLFKYYLLCMLLIFAGLTIIHLLMISSTLEFWITYGIALLIIIAACVPSWAGYIWISFKKDETTSNSSALKVSRKMWKSTAMRVMIWLAVSTVILFCSITGINECLDGSFFQPLKMSNFTNGTDTSHDRHHHKCEYPWFYTMCAALAMTTTSVFLRIHFLIKLLVNGLALAVFWYVMDIRGEEAFRQQTAKLADWEEFGLPIDQGHCYYLAFALLILHVIDRQVEYVCRLDYLMKLKLKAEQEEAGNVELVNRMLLNNIVPPHVSRFYLRKQQEDDHQRVEANFHEERSAVAVLFASIPSFADFYYEDGQNEEGLRCIQLLNEIICDFDLLLRKREFNPVEKIKTIGSTYMAACGLYSQEKGSFVMEEDPTRNVVTLVKFAVEMMSSLQEINKDAMQDFQLRVGISVGPVMAGVVGTVKPQYDIWGDTVNVASRMDSTGISGRIQVIKEVADLLSTSGCPYKCECRGEIFVKGKGKLTTYLLETPFDEPCIQTTQL